VIDKNLPFIKNLSVQILESFSINRENSRNEISKYIWDFYNINYPDIAVAKKDNIEKSIEHINRIYLRNYFHDMNTNWKHFPNNIGHLYSQGCFRCHSRSHKFNDGKVVSHDCNVCHTIISQQSYTQLEKTRGIDLPFKHPCGDNLNIENRMCYDCHSKKSSKK